MRIWPVALLLSVAFCSSASARPLRGKVVETESRWGYQGKAIVTESVVEKADGSRVRVHQMGGSKDGIGMLQSHAPSILASGDQVVLETETVQSANGRRIETLRQIVELRPAAALPDKNANFYEFVRTENVNAKDIYWKSGCALMSPASEGSSDIAGEREFEVIDQVLSHWRSETQSCSYFELINDGRETREVGLDGINLIKFREDFWCRPASGDDPQECYDQAAAAITTLFFFIDGSSRDGEIIDADIEFNAVQFAVSVDGVSGGSQECQADLANTLTHEIGHLLGLDHTCWTGAPTPPRLNDNTGAQVPRCSSTLGSDITEATMYNFQACGETRKASLEPDDIAGMCSIYPQVDSPNECKPADISTGGCCSVTGQRTRFATLRSGATLLLFAALALFLFRRRRA